MSQTDASMADQSSDAPVQTLLIARQLNVHRRRYLLSFAQALPTFFVWFPAFLRRKFRHAHRWRAAAALQILAAKHSAQLQVVFPRA